MPPTLILVRHAEALHNQTNNIHDPELSELGQRQCRDLRKNLMGKIPKELDVGLIIVSPMIRTIQTALLAFGGLVEKGVPIQAHASWQENSAKPCDTGSSLDKLKTMFPQVDFSHVDPVFPDKTSPAGAKYAYTKQAIVGRAQDGLRELYQRPEKFIIVVSHSGFLRLGVTGHYYFNADYRIFDFHEPQDDQYTLKQWESTSAGGLGWSWEKTVQIGEGLPVDYSA
ncbi:histidine phosphatase superfamily [Podospora aff. communis PSN243]|uniref:Histidine phosphatase superfamily n=1 Tax=Podospora aff. communis PSN243 TaxID=3040156 RepID=A0AAV9G5Y3_9PEZI|nr:histidine phosphatase superfamily [Podospora aff. communis PSN243]